MSTMAPGVDLLDFELPGSTVVGPFEPILVGVVGSGNLEVLLEPQAGQTCRFQVETSARGFATIWEAVVGDFQRRNSLAGVPSTNSYSEKVSAYSNAIAGPSSTYTRESSCTTSTIRGLFRRRPLLDSSSSFSSSSTSSQGLG